jgi:hypothetical protein
MSVFYWNDSLNSCVQIDAGLDSREFRESSVECPTCQGRVLCAGTIPLDLEASEECCVQVDNDVKVLRLLYSELNDQTEAVAQKVSNMDQKIQKALEQRALLK